MEETRRHFAHDFWGFWMLGGMSGGGMGFIVAPQRRTEAQARLQQTMSAAKRRLENALPFAMEPVVYDFAINEQRARGIAGRRRRAHAFRLLSHHGSRPHSSGTPFPAGSPPRGTRQVWRRLP